MEIADQAPLGLGAVLSGTAWVMRPGEEPVRLAPRDVAVLSGSEPYVVADSPDTRPTLRIHPGGSCEALPGARVDDSARLGTRTFGGRPDGEAWVVSGSYQRVGDVGPSAARCAPADGRVPAHEAGAGHGPMLEEIRRDRLGQQSVLDRWLDLALISTLRAWFDGLETRAPGWYRAHEDPGWGTRCG